MSWSVELCELVISCLMSCRYEQTCNLLETRRAHIMKQQAAMVATPPKKSVKKQNSKVKMNVITACVM